MIAYPVRMLLTIASAALGALLLSWILIMVLRPLLVRHALAHPNARSSHLEPVPQGGGVAVVIATLVATWSAIALAPNGVAHLNGQLAVVTIALVMLSLVGVFDDIRSLPAALRLLVQCLAVGIVIAALPREFQIVPFVPQWIDRACLLIGAMWFVNLVNFMDGIDWMTVAEVVPVSGAMVLLGLYGGVGIVPTLVAAALFGAMLGFAPFNKPAASLFLGDAGSLPIGLLLAWMLLNLAGKGHAAAAALLPLYYLADATITLGGRIARGERVWEAHRNHFYQRATSKGFTVSQVVGRVAATNLALAMLALVTVAAPSVLVTSLALTAGAALVGWLLISFARGKAG